jgi:hypothetical protein
MHIQEPTFSFDWPVVTCTRRLSFNFSCTPTSADRRPRYKIWDCGSNLHNRTIPLDFRNEFCAPPSRVAYRVPVLRTYCRNSVASSFPSRGTDDWSSSSYSQASLLSFTFFSPRAVAEVFPALYYHCHYWLHIPLLHSPHSRSQRHPVGSVHDTPTNPTGTS